MRPYVPARTVVRNARYTPEEWQMIEDAAAIRRKRPHTYVRDTILAAASRDVARVEKKTA